MLNLQRAICKGLKHSEEICEQFMYDSLGVYCYATKVRNYFLENQHFLSSLIIKNLKSLHEFYTYSILKALLMHFVSTASKKSY